jgi:hypothetical protein
VARFTKLHPVEGGCQKERESVKTGGGPKPLELKDGEEKVSHKFCIINNYCA